MGGQTKLNGRSVALLKMPLNQFSSRIYERSVIAVITI